MIVSRWKLSDDPGSKEKGGDLGYFTADKMVKEFSDFSFNGKTGEKKVIKTQFGYHYVEILDQKSFEPAYKIAYIQQKDRDEPGDRRGCFPWPGEPVRR